MGDQQKELQGLSDEYQQLQTGLLSFHSSHVYICFLTLKLPCVTELEGIVEGRQKLEAQQQENKSVQKVRIYIFHGARQM